MRSSDPIHAVVISIGDELVLGQSLDTNGQWIATRLGAMGFAVREHRTVADDREAIATAIRHGRELGAIVITTGGLGPTEDDLTRFALGDVVDPGAELVRDPAAEKMLRAWFDRRGRRILERNLVQTLRPPHAEMLPNERGTAPGLAVRDDRGDVCVLPGPPWEMRGMFEAIVEPRLRSRWGDRRTTSRSVHAYGLGESVAAERLGELLRRGRRPLIGISARQGHVSATVRVLDDGDDAVELVDADCAAIERAWRPYVYGTDGVTIESVLLDLLKERGETVVTAESCTGGWLGKALVDVPGSSSAYAGGWITYTNAAKARDLGVDPELIDAQTAVSEPVARQMAIGAVDRADANWSVSITGISGPDGGTPEQPVGTVFIGVGWRAAAGSDAAVRRFQFPGDRTRVRDRAVGAAMQVLRLSLLGEGDAPMLWEAPPDARTP